MLETGVCRRRAVGDVSELSREAAHWVAPGLGLVKPPDEKAKDGRGLEVELGHRAGDRTDGESSSLESLVCHLLLLRILRGLCAVILFILHGLLFLGCWRGSC